MNGKTRRFALDCLVLLVGSAVFLGLGGISSAVAADAGVITTGTLFEEMIDMRALSRFPEPAYRMVQFSSYDHRSTLPGGPDWFANSDGFGGEPVPNFEKVLKAPNAKGVGEYLIADVKGPGAIVRLWTAAISGEIRMHIDGAETPVFEGSANDFFHRPYDHFEQTKALDTNRFGRTVYQRDASYAPIPFAQRLRVVWTGNVKHIHFYQLQVRLYDKSARVVSFRPEDIAKYKETIDKVTLSLADPDEDLALQSQQAPQDFEARLAPAEKKTVLALDKGGQAIEQLTLQLEADDLDLALRQTVLEITCDEYPWAQVQSPVGDFFGAAPGVNPYQSLPFTVRPDGTMISRFVMPFERSCRIELTNQGKQPVRIKGSVLAMKSDWDERSMHFRARWRVDHDLLGSNQAVQDLPFLLAHGKGTYVGTGAYLMNPADVPTPYGNWWGEGDEKVFVDDEPAPSLFGTGSEDYFNYSWSSPDIFLFPYCGQPRDDGPGNRGFVTNYRWHVLDPIPFQENIRFYMELYCHEPTPGMSYARIGYHYARPGLTDDHLAPTPSELRVPLLPDNWQPVAKKGSANAKFYAAEDIITDAEGTRLQEGRLWAGGKLLTWLPRKNGACKSLTLPIDAAGKKQIYATMALTPQAGTVAFLLDGEPIKANGAETVDLYRPHRTLLRNIRLEQVELKAGDHTLTVEWKGASNDVSEPEVGIDFFWVQPR